MTLRSTNMKRLTQKQQAAKLETIAATFGLLTLKSTFSFGKYKGKSVNVVMRDSPDYIVWVHTNTNHKFTPTVIDKALSKIHAKSSFADEDRSDSRLRTRSVKSSHYQCDDYDYDDVLVQEFIYT